LPIPATEHVVNPAGIFDSGLSWHISNRTATALHCQYLFPKTDPFFPSSSPKAVIGNGLSAEWFAANEAGLLLKRLAYNLAGMLRGEREDALGTGWDLKRVQQTVLKAGARVVQHGGRLLVDVARAAGVLWGRRLERVNRWWRDAAWGRRGPRRRRWVAPPAQAHLCLVLRE